MARLSISRAWEESREVLARDGKLIFTVALALIALPEAIAGFVSPQQSATPNLSGSGVAFVVALIGIVAQLAMIRLAIGPSLTVGEAIGHGARRFIPYLLAAMLLVLALILAAIPIGGLLYALGLDFKPPVNTIPAIAWIVILPVMLLLFAVAVRLMMMAPVASAEAIGPVAILRRSWEITAGSFWRLLGFLLLFAIAALILLAVVGALAGILALALLGQPEPLSVSALVIALLTAIASATVSTLFVVMLARMYVQLAGRREDMAEVFG